jgi:hypothetical protein
MLGAFVDGTQYSVAPGGLAFAKGQAAWSTICHSSTAWSIPRTEILWELWNAPQVGFHRVVQCFDGDGEGFFAAMNTSTGNADARLVCRFDCFLRFQLGLTPLVDLNPGVEVSGQLDAVSMLVGYTRLRRQPLPIDVRLELVRSAELDNESPTIQL